MIKDEKYVKIVSSPAEKVKTEVNVNNQDITITQNGDYQAEPPYTGFGLVRVAVPTGSGVINPLSVSPSTQAQVINAPTGVDGFNPVSVAAVTAVIDSNIQANNIKAGISILGVTGNIIELNGEERTVSLTSSSGNTFTPSSGKNAITSITVTPNNYAEGTGMYGPVYEIVASTDAQNIQIPQGYSGFANLFCDGVDASIDPNIVAGNIKKNVTILGVTGTLEGGSVPEHYVEKISVNGKLKNSTNIIDLTGITDVDESVLGYQYKRVSFPTNTNIDLSPLTTISGSTACYYMFMGCSGITSVDLSGLTTVSGQNACSYMFQYCSDITSINLSALTTISSLYGCSYMFQYCSGLTSISLPNLTTISGGSACLNMFANCTGLTSVIFPSLSVISGFQACQGMFQNSSNLTSLSFPALTSSSFGTQTMGFSALIYNVTGCTIHFPSNLDPSSGSTVISSLQGYPSFGGTNTVLAFDLPATE